MPTVNTSAAATVTPTVINTAERLAHLADLLVEHGAESALVNDYIHQHENDREFAELAPLSIALKRALTVRSDDSKINANPSTDSARATRHDATGGGPVE